MKTKQYLIHLRCQKPDKAVSYLITGKDFCFIYDWAEDKMAELSRANSGIFRIIGIYEVLYDVEKLNKSIRAKTGVINA